MVVKQRQRPMRYEYWTRDNNNWVAVALYFDRILACSSPAYYVELPDDPHDADVVFGAEGRELIANLRLDTEREHWRYVGDPDIRYLPSPPVVNTLRETLTEMRVTAENHRLRWGKSADRLAIECDLGDFEHWIDSIARYVVEGRVSGEEEGRYPLEMSEMIGGLRFLTWLQKRGGSILIPKTDANGEADGVDSYGTDEELTALGIRWAQEMIEEDADAGDDAEPGDAG